MDMTYEVNTTHLGGELYSISVDVIKNNEIILSGETTVSTEEEEKVEHYAERIFLPDLRRNNKLISGLVLDWEIPEEPEYDSEEFDDDESEV